MANEIDYATEAAEIVALVRSSHVSHDEAVRYVALNLEIAVNKGMVAASLPFISPQLVQMDDRTGDGWNM